MINPLELAISLLAVVAAIFTGGLAGAVFTQFMSAKRELKLRRDQLRLDLYQRIIDLISDFERIRSNSEYFAPAQFQSEQIRIAHRVGLLASSPVSETYKQLIAAMYCVIDDDTKKHAEGQKSVDSLKFDLVRLMRKEFGALLT